MLEPGVQRIKHRFAEALGRQKGALHSAYLSGAEWPSNGPVWRRVIRRNTYPGQISQWYISQKHISQWQIKWMALGTDWNGEEGEGGGEHSPEVSQLTSDVNTPVVCLHYLSNLSISLWPGYGKPSVLTMEMMVAKMPDLGTRRHQGLSRVSCWSSLSYKAECLWLSCLLLGLGV